MSENLLRFLLAELKTVRIRCLNPACGAVVEIPVEKLAHLFSTDCCPVCRQVRRTPAGQPLLPMLAQAIDGIAKGLGGSLEVEFVLTEKP